MTNGDSEGRIFLTYPHTNNGFFFLLTFQRWPVKDEDPKAVVPLGMSYKRLSSFYYVCVYEQKINVVALIVSMVQVPSTSAQLLQKTALHKNRKRNSISSVGFVFIGV